MRRRNMPRPFSQHAKTYFGGAWEVGHMGVAYFSEAAQNSAFLFLVEEKGPHSHFSRSNILTINLQIPTYTLEKKI